MLDFNTKKALLRRLKAKRSKNKLLWLPCVIAELFVKLWYALLCRADLALSDKNGNFLGVKKPKEKSRARRQDDIVYVKKPFWGRVMSAVLAAAFLLMVAPELDIDLGITAGAVGTAISVKDDDTGKTYRLIPKIDGATVGETEAYLEDEYLHARDCVTADITSLKTANGALQITWAYRVEAGCNHVDESGRHFSTDYPVTNIIDHYIVRVENASGYKRDFEYPNNQTSAEITGLPNNDNEYTVTIIPIAKMQLWRFRQGDPDATDEQLQKTVVGQVSGRKDSIVESDIRHTFSIQYGVYFNAKLDKPNLTVGYDNNGIFTAFPSGEEYSYDDQVYLKWNKVVQQGGNDVGGEATGYRVHVSDNGGTTWRQTAYPRTDSRLIDDGDSFRLAVSVNPGLHYQFFVEAYKVNWPENSTEYNTGNPGMITSASNPVGNGKDLYTAPVTPDITATQRVSANGSTFYEINVSHLGGDNNYDGIYLFRTEGEEITDEYLKNHNIENPYSTFGEWLAKTATRDGNKAYFNLKVMQSAFVNSNTYSDNDIIEGKTYYYYAVAHRDIQSGSSAVHILYARRYTYTNTTFRLDSFKKIVPVINKVTSADGQVTIEWDPINNAERYELQARQTGIHDENNKTVDYDGVWETIYNGPNRTYVHDNLYNSDRYEYRVRAVVDMRSMEDENTVSEQITTQWSKIARATVGTLLDTPMNVRATSSDGQAVVSWDAVSGATGYDLHYTSNDPEDPQGVIGGLKRTTYTHTNIKNDKVYTYWVVAYKEIAIGGDPQNPQKVTGKESNKVKIRIGQALTTPQNLKATTTDGTVNISWNAVAGASGYKLHYKYVKKNGETSDYTEKNVFDVTSPSYIHSGLNNGDRYTYYVEAYKEVSGEPVYGPQSDEVWVIVGVPLDAPKDFSGTTTDGIVNLTWTAVRGAEGYMLYFRRNGGGWQEIDISRTTFQHTGLNNGDRYEYYVKAYKTVNGERVYSFDESNHLNFTIGDELDSPKDFNVVTTDGQASLTWTTVRGAEGYIVYAYGGGRSYQFDVSRNAYVHTNLINGDSWTYYVVAYKTVNGTRVYSSPTKSITITTGISINAVIDLTATAGNRQVDLSWTAVKGAEGYVVYLYNSKTMEFEPITVISGTKYSHTGLKNGQKYTYMVAPYKTVNGERFYGEYSMSVTATPSTGSITDIDTALNVRGTTPYGISHSEYIDASANHAAFDEAVDVYFTTNKESTDAVKDVLKNYADGLKSFIIYPFDISIYREGTKIEVDPNPGYTVTITMPIPDRLIAYRDYITVVHIGDGMVDTEEITADDSAEDWIRTADTTLEVLPCAIVDIDNIWCVQFVCSSFSPYALVIYKEHIQDISSGGGIINGDFAGIFNSGVLLSTTLPDIMPHNKKLKVVQGGKKRYRIKSVEKR